jgi:23S rRNA U2552 (ribose-2'-O)-methylase RlmE/FtsJ
MKLKDLFDSSPKSTDKWSRYFDVYQRYLEKYEGKNITFIEVGVQNGGSMEMWSKFFGPESKLYGIDIDPKCAELKYDNPNVNIIIGDQESKEFWDTILPSIGPIDVFIDDGGHFIPQQIVTFEKVWNKIKKNGVYICEDTHTSYFQRFNSSYKSQNSFIEYAKDFADILHLKKTDQYNSRIGENISNIIRSNENLVKKEFAHDLSSIHFYDSMIVIEKDEIVPMERIVHAGVI